jgi:4-hydroxybenzoate polyprenyltransferase
MNVAVKSGLPRFSHRFLLALYLLEFVGASAVAGLGCIACRALGVPWRASVPLWWASYLFVYNSDRLYRDPADETNTPIRRAWAERLRPWRLAVSAGAAIVLLFWPLLTRRAQLLPVIGVAAGALQFYSRPVPFLWRWRLKDLPGIKSSLAAVAIAIMLIAWPCWDAGRSFDAKESLVFTWGFLALQINALVYDVRDLPGDQRCGTRTVAVWLGSQRTRRVIYALLCLYVVLGLTLQRQQVLTTGMVAAAGTGAGTLGWLLASPFPSRFWMGVAADLFLLAPSLAAWV